MLHEQTNKQTMSLPNKFIYADYKPVTDTYINHHMQHHSTHSISEIRLFVVTVYVLVSDTVPVTHT